MSISEPKLEIDCSGVHRLAISPSGNRVAALDGPINIYDVNTSARIGQLPETDNQANCLMFSPDGEWLVAAGGGDEFDAMNRIRIYDAQSFEKLIDWEATSSKGSNVRMCRFNSDSSLLVSSGVDARVRLWDTKTWNEVNCLVGHEANVQDVCFSSDGARLVSGGLDGKPRTWDVASHQVITVFEGHQAERNYSVAISPDGSAAVSGGSKGKIFIWDPVTAKQISEIETGDATNYLAFTPDGKALIAVLWDGPFLVIDPSTWDVIHKIEASKERTHGHALSSDGSTLVTASIEGKIKLWDILALKSSSSRRPTTQAGKQA